MSQYLLVKINGAALVYALLIFFVASTIIGGVSLLESYNRKSHLKLSWKHKLRQNVDSGINLLAAPDFSTNNEWLEIDLFGDEDDSVRLKKIEWGVFDIAISVAHKKHYTKRKAVMLGSKFTPKYALYLADMNRELQLSGETRLEGIVHLPAKGVKRGNTEKSPCQGSKLVYGATKKSNKRVPELSSYAIDKLYKPFLSDNDSIVFVEYLYQDSIRRPFDDHTVVLEATADLELYESNLHGNCIVMCSGDLYISSTAQLSDIIVYAKKVFIEEGFSGSLQIFARDSVFIGNQVTLHYPSVVYSMPYDQKHPGSITVGDDCRISGELMTYQPKLERNNWPKITIGHQSIVQGIVYTNGYLELHGKIAGTATASKMIYAGKPTVQENCILNGEVLQYSISDQFLSGRLFSNQPNTILKSI